MTKDTALKMAIDAMENCYGICDAMHHSKKDRHEYDEKCPVTTRWYEALDACKEALKPHPNCDEACMFQCEMEKENNQWQGLTDFELKDIRTLCDYSQYESAGEWAYRVQLATEQALKDKNT